MTDHMIPEVVDLTEPGDSPRCAEVLTEAGVIRVDTGKVAASSGRRVITVTVDPNTRWEQKTHPGGHWTAGTKRLRGCTVVVITRTGDGDDRG